MAEGQRIILLLVIIVVLISFFGFYHPSSSSSSSSSSSFLPNRDASMDSIPCGDVCRYDFPETEGKIFPVIKKKINCPNLMKRNILSRPAKVWPPPKSPPEELLAEFTQNGEMPITESYYFAQRYSGAKALLNQWTVELIEKKREDQRNHIKIGGYGLYDEDNIRESLKRFSVKGERGAVLGSEQPWLEAIILDAGAAHVVTIEYGEINSLHPQITTMIPAQAAEKYLKGELEPFDFIYTYSSLEHSGLGRYGDPLNPYGDLEAAAQAWCMLKPGGLFFLGLPVAKTSHIRFNADRKYGPERMKHIAVGFEQVEHIGGWFKQAIFVLRKEEE